ncbi:MAG: SMP-30/gluconolactonase/LRE family protein [Aurantibacter sp.]
MSISKSQKAKLLFDAQCTLGEGPVWDWREQLLYWVDIEGYKLHQYSPSAKKNQSWDFDEMIGAAVPMKNGHLLLAMEKGLTSFDFDTGKLTRYGILENSNPSMRFNDGKIGPDGNFWIGTMDKKCAPKAGNFYRVDSNLLSTLQISQTSVSNGMAWTSNHKTFYYIDSPAFEVRAFDFDLENGSISNGRSAFTIPKDYGSPDGMSIDEEDMLWIAHWGGNCVRRWNPATGNALEKIEVNAPHVTSCCFGGKDLKTLYITTARSGLDEKQLQEYPLSGGLFVHETNVGGTQINYFDAILGNKR